MQLNQEHVKQRQQDTGHCKQATITRQDSLTQSTAMQQSYFNLDKMSQR
jgi:hypothetical protein